jgi:hypothetical protein
MRWISTKSDIVSMVCGVTTVALACYLGWKHDLIPNSFLGLALLGLVLLGTNWGTYLLARDVAAARSARPSGPGETPAAARLLILLDIYMEDCGDNPYAMVRRKLRIVLKNASTSNLLLSPPTWRREPDDLSVQSQPRRYWELESALGWAKVPWRGKESESIFVPPGKAVCTWIAIEPTADQDDVRRRHIARQLGTLIVPATADGKTTEQIFRL